MLVCQRRGLVVIDPLACIGKAGPRAWWRAPGAGRGGAGGPPGGEGGVGV